MIRARNKVISGDFQGKLVGHGSGNPFISLSFTKFLFLGSSTVASVVLLDEDSEVSVASAATRGFIGEMLFGPIGLAAAATAKRSGIHVLEIEFRDGKRSVLEVDDKVYASICRSTQGVCEKSL